MGAANSNIFKIGDKSIDLREYSIPGYNGNCSEDTFVKLRNLTEEEKLHVAKKTDMKMDQIDFQYKYQQIVKLTKDGKAIDEYYDGIVVRNGCDYEIMVNTFNSSYWIRTECYDKFEGKCMKNINYVEVKDIGK